MSDGIEELKGKLMLERAEVRRLREHIAALEARTLPDPAEGDRLRARIAELENDVRMGREARNREDAAWRMRYSSLDAKVVILRRQVVEYLKAAYAPQPVSEKELAAKNTEMLMALILMAGPIDKVQAAVLPPEIVEAIRRVNESWALGDVEVAKKMKKTLDEKMVRRYPNVYREMK